MDEEIVDSPVEVTVGHEGPRKFDQVALQLILRPETSEGAAIACTFEQRLHRFRVPLSHVPVEAPADGLYL